MKIGYLRVSTEEQRPDRQIDGLAALCDEIQIETLSAVSKHRPVYEAVTQKLRSGDTLVVWDLDRAFRSTIDALLEAEKLRERSIGFQIVTLNVDTSTPAGELVYTVMAAYAQFERQNLIKRTKEGMDAARKRGVHVGRVSNAALREAHAAIAAGDETLASMAVKIGCAEKTLVKGFERLGLSALRMNL